MKHTPRQALLGLLATVMCALSGVLPADAVARDGWMSAQERGRGERPSFASPARRDDRSDDFRDYRSSERSAPSSPQRLSPDERRQLRQDLHDANRDMRRRRSDGRR